MSDHAGHRITIVDRGYGAWADCQCGWESQWYEHRSGAELARDGHRAWVELGADNPRRKQGRRYPDLREQLIDRCTCGAWRWNNQCHNLVCWTNLNHTKEAA